MLDISLIEDCFGCGVCSIICPKQLIGIKLNLEGFYTPYLLNTESCTNCGLCISVCAYSNHETKNCKTVKIDSYAIWSNDFDILNNCSSGGVGFELGKLLINQGYKACGVRYNISQQRAEHFIAESVDEYKASIGSKYIQSYTANAFSQFNSTDKYFVTGTPCQIDSLRFYIQSKKIEDNFVLMDFFCHGVPSIHLWNQYLKIIKKKVGDPESVSWRNKTTGWHDSWAMTASSKKKQWFSLMSKGDFFYKMFLSDICLGKACYEKCKYKMVESSADIRIGDLWGNTYKNNCDGVSGVLIFTEKGRRLLEKLKLNCIVKPEPISVVTEGQMAKPPLMPKIRTSVLKSLQKGKSLKYTIYIKINPFLLKSKLVRKLKQIL